MLQPSTPLYPPQGYHKDPHYHPPPPLPQGYYHSPELDFLKKACNRLFDFASEIKYSNWYSPPTQPQQPQQQHPYYGNAGYPNQGYSQQITSQQGISGQGYSGQGYSGYQATGGGGSIHFGNTYESTNLGNGLGGNSVTETVDNASESVNQCKLHPDLLEPSVDFSRVKSESQSKKGIQFQDKKTADDQALFLQIDKAKKKLELQKELQARQEELHQLITNCALHSQLDDEKRFSKFKNSSLSQITEIGLQNILNHGDKDDDLTPCQSQNDRKKKKHTIPDQKVSPSIPKKLIAISPQAVFKLVFLDHITKFREGNIFILKLTLQLEQSHLLKTSD
ncbi:hypothetical protein FGO68_gene12648 [Halteria grandinella]|uniref:Uncharacterized protein n=1 Tax=Halteria grandinella TaxID=5974 RepID=A0A8J8P2J8_HALGN|nr:hypothetical protein FGO68_gene12648 [Halteria grandinella]